MKRTAPTLLLVLIAACFGHAQSETPAVTVARWPGDRLAAISLTFDDAMNTQLDNVAPILKKHQLTGTFFVSTGRSAWTARKKDWQQLATDGNEIGNHTVNHPCLLKEIEPHSQDYTPEMMEAEVRDATVEIVKTIGSHRGLVFAYPCGNTSFGPPREQARNQALYLTYVSHYAFAARGYETGGAQDPDDMNILTIRDVGITEGKDFGSLLHMTEAAVAANNWGVYCFHGVGGEWLAIKAEALDELAGYLERHSEIWTTSFGDAVRYIQERKASSLETRQSGDGSFDVRLSWPLEKEIYDLPLTLRIELPPTWKGLLAVANGNSLLTTLKPGRTSAIALVRVAPGTEAVHLSKRSR
jgi:peptidoglycan/xylan/chitin deacetylase (PgdA/CDA1 family)